MAHAIADYTMEIKPAGCAYLYQSRQRLPGYRAARARRLRRGGQDRADGCAGLAIADFRRALEINPGLRTARDGLQQLGAAQ
jgi:hypothetical protein